MKLESLKLGFRNKELSHKGPPRGKAVEGLMLIRIHK